MPEKDWSPEDEVDPIKLAQEQLAIGKRFMEKMEKIEKAEAEEKARREAYKKEVNDAPPPGFSAVPYKPPSPEQVSEVLKKAWEETKRIMPDAPEAVQMRAFETLMHAFSPLPWVG
jgi:hypothetical protein